MLYKETLTAHQWPPTVSAKIKYIENELRCLLVEVSTERWALLHVYIACQTKRNYDYIQWNEDLFYLISQEAINLRKQGFIVLALVDFNSGSDRQKVYTLTLQKPTTIHPCSSISSTKSNGLFTRFMNNSEQPGSKSLMIMD